MDPLPEGGLPADQTVEGGAQVRVTPAGFTKLTSIVPPVINDALGDGFCIGQINQGIGVADLKICDKQTSATCNPGCQVDVQIDHVNMSVPNDSTFRVDVQFDVKRNDGTPIKVPVSAYDPLFGFKIGSCDFNVSLNNGKVIADIGFGIRPSDGELTINLQSIQTFDISGFNLGGCGVLGDILGAVVNTVADLLSTQLGNWVINLLSPIINDILQGMLPSPLGIAGMVDIGSLVGAISPGTNATLEARIVPGGYVQLKGGGLSLGIITGLNADEDISTRTPGLTSEPALCVPPVPAPDFAAAPHNLSKSVRNTFKLDGAGEFMGAPDPAAELAIGLSETTLDLGGHHAFTSGALCLGVGTNLIEQLNLGTVGLLVPSLAELGNPDGKDPLLLVTRPQRAVDFTIGDGTATSPALTIHLQNFEVDFYAFLFERYVRGFSIGLTMDVGVNLEFTLDANGKPAILPMLVGLEADKIQLTVHNSEFLRESNTQLEKVLPAIFDLALPLIADGLDAFTLPEFAGFTLTNLKLAKVTTSEDDFLAIYASLGQSQAMMQLADQYPSLHEVLAVDFADELPDRAVATARLESVVTPRPAMVRAGLARLDGGALPEVVIDVDTHDAQGRPLEWTWNLDGGLWRPFTQASPLVIRDRAFALQGRFTIGLRARVVGDYRTTQLDPHFVPVVIDSVGPRIHGGKATVKDGELVVPVTDLVSADDAIVVAFGRPETDPAVAEVPWTDFGANRIGLAELRDLAVNDKIVVFAKDELGNQSSQTVDLGPVVNFHGSAGESDCNCSSGPTDAASARGLALLAGLTMLLLGGLRRPRRALGRALRHPSLRRLYVALPYVGFAVGMSLMPGCSCANAKGEDVTCELDEDCQDLCAPDEVGICFDNKCVCADDVPYGRMGQYSEMAVSSNGTAWVSAYNSSHGDLVVASWPGAGRIPDDGWEFVDGVPDGPVVLPDSEIRGGIFAAGPDVGLYTSIAVAPPNDVPMVSYFNRDTGSLQFAARYDGVVWSKHTVQTGRGEGDPELGFEIVGQYSSITTRTDDGRPGIAYFAHVSEGGGNARTEVRFAAAQTPTPSGPQDWNIWVVDSAAVPPPDQISDPYPIPMGTGLFIATARLSDQAPVIVYYDRLNGALKLARFDAVTGAFREPETLAGHNGDAGWYPSVAVDENDELHISYVDATYDDLHYINTIDLTPQLVDDGYRIVGQTADGLPKPEFHFVGDDSSVVLTNLGPVVVYQNATTHELLLAYKDNQGRWQRDTIAGAEDPFQGGYGFYASAKLSGDQVVMSTWVIDQPSGQVWVELFRKQVVIE